MSQILEAVTEAVCGTARANNLDLSELQAERIARSAILATLRAIREPTEGVYLARWCNIPDREDWRKLWAGAVNALIREVQA